MTGIMFMPTAVVIPAEPVLPEKPNDDLLFGLVIIYCCNLNGQKSLSCPSYMRKKPSKSGHSDQNKRN
jgi:hypothetical protein